MTMTSTLLALPAGATEVRVIADLDIVGRLAQFGRGMIESVNKQMFKQFTDCLRATLETGTGSSVADVIAPTGAPPPERAAKEPVRLLPIVMRAGWENVARMLGWLGARIGKRRRKGA
jgi:hypothetical protein